MSSAAAQVDSHIEIVTPENIAFEYRLAGPFRRLPAFLIDLLIRIVVLIGCAIALVTALGALGGGLLLVVWFALTWFYGGLFEALWNGQTPGKRILGLRVVSIEGQPITGWQAVLRNLLSAVDCLPAITFLQNYFFLPLYSLGLLTAASNKRFQRLGDLAAGTMVIVEEDRRLYGLTRVTDAKAIELARVLPGSFSMDRGMSKALATYVDRRRVFAPARMMEIARTLGEPLVERYGLPPDTNCDTLLLALYYRTFVSDRLAREEQPVPLVAEAVGGRRR